MFAIIIGSHFKGFIIAECFVFFLVFWVWFGLGVVLAWVGDRREDKRREKKRRESGCERSVKLS